MATAPPPFYSAKFGVSSGLRAAWVRAARENDLTATIKRGLTVICFIVRLQRLLAQKGGTLLRQSEMSYLLEMFGPDMVRTTPLWCNGGLGTSRQLAH